MLTSSGPVVPTTDVGGQSGNVGLLPLSGRGGGVAVALVGGATPDTQLVWNHTQAFPRNATLTSFSGSFVLRDPLSLVGMTVALKAQLYAGTGGGLTPVAGATCTGADLTGVMAAGTVVDCLTTGLSIPLVAGTRAVIAVSATSFGAGLLNQAPDLTGALSLAFD